MMGLNHLLSTEQAALLQNLPMGQFGAKTGLFQLLDQRSDKSRLSATRQARDG